MMSFLTRYCLLAATVLAVAVVLSDAFVPPATLQRHHHDYGRAGQRGRGRSPAGQQQQQQQQRQHRHHHEDGVVVGLHQNQYQESLNEYSRCLDPNAAPVPRDSSMMTSMFEFDQQEEDKPIWRRVVNRVFTNNGKTMKSKTKAKTTKPGALILLHCGLSEYSLNQTFAGWLDPRLSEEGIRQCQHAGRLLLAEGFEPSVVYTSRLRRAIDSAWRVMEVTDTMFIPTYKSYRLNQRMYGTLQGVSKLSAAQRFGTTVVDAWRNRLKARPPALGRDDARHPIYDRRYADLDPTSQLPDTESLLDCQERARPLWSQHIRHDLAAGKNVLVVGHRDSLRGLVKEVEGRADDDDDDEWIGNVDLPHGVPMVYKFDMEMSPIDLPGKAKSSSTTDDTTSLTHTRGIFLEQPSRLKEVMAMEEKYRALIHTDGTIIPERRRATTLEESLTLMNAVQREQQEQSPPDDNNDVNDAGLGTTTTMRQPPERWSDDPCEFEEYDEFDDYDDDEDPGSVLHGGSTSQSTVINVLPLEESRGEVSSSNMPDAEPKKREGPFVVLVRHGRTPHNNMGLFTGWEDPPLASEGEEDAKNAGRLLKKYGFEFDVAYTSWLTRAIQTAYYIIDELDEVWLPVVKSWRLNERMYGDLTGKSKKMIANEYGEDQLKKWRRGYTVRPPPVSSYSLNYPGNDERRAKHFKDIRISIRETINRSLDSRKLKVARKLPKTESLKDCMDRSIPFYTEKIKREAVDKGKRILIASHENAIRGILMHLCDIPEEAVQGLHLPNGLPLVYNVKGRCISLLEDSIDGSSPHDFGPAAPYLFKPCEITDEFYESMASK